MKLSIFENKVHYKLDTAEAIASMLQKSDPEWQYVVRKDDDNINACVEVLDTEGYHLGYM